MLAHKGSAIKKAAGLAVKGAVVAGAVALGATAVKAGASLIKPWFFKPVVVAKPTLSYIPVYEVRYLYMFISSCAFGVDFRKPVHPLRNLPIFIFMSLVV